MEDSLLLWLNKVSEAVGREQREEAKRKLKDPDARQRRRNRLQLMSEGDMIIPHAADLCSAVTDGQCLAALLVHYIPHGTKWSGRCPLLLRGYNSRKIKKSGMQTNNPCG